MCNPRVAIVGVGNILMGDDGVGVHVIERLRRQTLPEGVDLFDAGTAIQDVMPRLADYDRVILVDAIRAGDAPGAIHTFDLGPEDLGAPRPGLSLHDVNVLDALRLQAIAGERIPPIRVLGVEPRRTDMELDLSDEARARVPELCLLALKAAGEAAQTCAETGG